MLHWYNADMRRILLFLLIFGALVGFVLVACSSMETQPVPESSQTEVGTLRPFPSPTSSATPFPTDYVSPTPSPTVTPTPTPVLYEVQSEDDMYSIAFRYGIEPAALMTANPTVNPRMMSVGMTLLIPISPSPEPTPTASLAVSTTPTEEESEALVPDCYPNALGGLWCFVLVENEADQARENISALVTLAGEEQTREEVAIAPLNLLPAGRSLALAAYFQPPIPASYSVTAIVDFWLPAMPGDGRYLDVTLDSPEINLNESERAARVRGELILPADQGAAQYVWVNATAFDGEGHVVGVRRWESTGSLAAGETVTFDFYVYSLAGEIDNVDVLVEARRVEATTPEP
jgi:LysM repeat protein